MISYPAYLSVDRIALQIHLGQTEEERRKPQAVEIDLRFYFPEVPAIARQDEGGFICYGKITQHLARLCEGKEFRMVEFLGMQIYHAVRSEVEAPVKIWLKVHKCRVPVEQVQGGASYTYTDLAPAAWRVPS